MLVTPSIAGFASIATSGGASRGALLPVWPSNPMRPQATPSRQITPAPRTPPLYREVSVGFAAMRLGDGVGHSRLELLGIEHDLAVVDRAHRRSIDAEVAGVLDI